MRRVLAILCLASILAAFSVPAAGQMVGLPNPASTFCVDSGGTLVITDTAAGQAGTCVYDNGLAVDEWALYRLFSGLLLPTAW